MTEEKKKLTVNMDKKLYETFHVECIKNDEHMTDVVRELIREWLEEHED